MKTLLLAAPLALVLGQAAVAQQKPDAASPWVETRFHRVHLRNGNFIDGQLVQQNAKGVVLQMNPSGDFAVRKDLIQRVEYIKMRSLKEVPKVPKVEAPADPATPDLVKTPTPSLNPDGAKTPVPGTFRPEAVKAVDAILTTYALARSDMRRELAPQIRAVGPDGIAYACWVARTGRSGLEMPELIEAVGQLDGPEVLPALFAIVTDAKDSFERAAAVRMLAQKPTPEARAAVHRALGDPSGQVWRVAQEQILKLNEKGEADVEAVIDLLSTREEKSVIAQTLAKIGGDAAMDALRSLLTSGTQKDKVAAMRALGTSGKPEDGEAALALLGDADPMIRKDACQFIGKTQCGAAVRSLIDTLKDPEVTVVQAAHMALKQITSEPLEPKAERWETWWEQLGKAKYGAEK
jgi:hypothetical protein